MAARRLRLTVTVTVAVVRVDVTGWVGILGRRKLLLVLTAMQELARHLPSLPDIPATQLAAINAKTHQELA
jgi:hypothetical protein